MPVDPITLGTVGASVGIAGANLAFQGNMNRKNRRFAERQYRQQYQDQLEFWRLNNEYNHPEAQMERLRKAGLNPRSIYGSSPSGASGSSAGAPSAPSQARWQGTAPEINTINPMAMLDQFTNIEVKQAQADNFREQNTILKQEQELKRIGILAQTLDYDIKDTTKRAIIEKLLLDLDKTRVDIRKTEQSIALDAQKVANDIARTKSTISVQELQKIMIKAGISQKEAQTKSVGLDAQIKAVKYKLWRQGINPNDPTWVRMLARSIDEFLNGPIGKKLENLKPFFKQVK